MAPMTTNNPRGDQTVSEPAKSQGWSTATIILGAVFLFLLFAFIITLIAFSIHKRSLRKKLPKEFRSKSYHPFRTETTDKSALLSTATTPDEERTSMFSRQPSSVSLYVDTTPAVQHASLENVSLVPVYITPAERQDSMSGLVSDGSGVSASSSRYTRSALTLSPIQQEDNDLGARPTCPRSTSTTSLRYYRVNSLESAPPTNSSGPKSVPEN